MIADFYVPGKIYSAVGHLFAGVVAQSKNLRNLENVASMMDHEFGFEQIVEKVLQTTKSLEPATAEGLKGQILTEFMEAESNVTNVSKQAKDLLQKAEWEMEEVKDASGAIEKIKAKPPRNNRVTDQTLIESAVKKAQEYLKIPEEIIKEIKLFAQENRYMEVMLDGKLEIVEVDWEHILLPIIKERMPFNHATKMRELEDIVISGWHHGLWKDFEKQGLIKIINKVEKNGCTYL